MDYLRFLVTVAAASTLLASCASGDTNGTVTDAPPASNSTTAQPVELDDDDEVPCPVQVNCTEVTDFIPLRDLDRCNDGFYCACDDSLGIALLQQCPFDNILSGRRQKLDADQRECVSSDDFNCWNWLGLTPDASTLCPVAVNCTEDGWMRKIPIPIESECDAGYYCRCDSSGMAFKERCPYEGLLSLTPKKLDAYSMSCVKSDEFNCGNWINAPTTVPAPVTPLSWDCPIEVDCGAVPAGQKIPIPVESECDSGYYCECSEAGVASKKTCPFNSIISFQYKRLDAYTLECVKRNRFSCRSWIRNLLLPTGLPRPTTPRPGQATTAGSQGEQTTAANPTARPVPDSGSTQGAASGAAEHLGSLLTATICSVCLIVTRTRALAHYPIAS